MTDYAQLAQSLKDNEAFQAALEIMRGDALGKLAKIDADDKNGILKLQATVAVVEDIRDNLDTFIRAGAVRNPPGIA